MEKKAEEKLKNIQKSTKGITLIALVVTIVVLLILAGITITMVLGEDGILSQAKLAAQKTKEAEEQQAKDLDSLVGMINEAVNGKDPGTLQEALSSKKVFSHTTGFDASGNKIEEGSEESKTLAITIPAGFRITEGDLNSIDKGVVISDEAGNEFVWVPCTADQYKKHDYSKRSDKDDEGKNNGDENEGGWNTYSYTKYSDWTEENEAANKTSIGKYGGFYIARYEAGIPSSMTDVYVSPNNPTANAYVDENKKNTSAYAPVSKKGAQAWNYISQTNAKKAAEKMYSGNIYVTSQLVDGIAWDRTVDWIVEKSGVKSVGKDSTEYGNYANNGTNENNGGIKYKGFTVENTLWAEFLWQIEENGQPADKGWCTPKNYQYGIFTAGYSDPWKGQNKDNFNLVVQENESKTYKYRYYVEMATGASEHTKLNNIYDLAGNMYEWTTETGYHGAGNGTQYAVLRGGSYYHYGNSAPVAIRYGSNAVSVSDFYFGFRVVLYVK